MARSRMPDPIVFISYRRADSQHAVGRPVRPGRARPIQLQPVLVPRLEIGLHQRRLRGEVVVEAHLRDARLGRDRVDPRRHHPVGVEPPGRRIEDALSRAALTPRSRCRHAASFV